MEIVMVKVDDIKPYDNNPKEHTPLQVEKLARSIKEFGFNVPVILDKDYNIIAGHGRVLAATSLRLEKIPAVFKNDLTDAQVKAYRIADNKLAESNWNIDMLKQELKNLELGNYDLKGTGFDENELADIFKQIEFVSEVPDVDLEGDIPELKDCLVINTKNDYTNSYIKEFFELEQKKKRLDGSRAVEIIKAKTTL